MNINAESYGHAVVLNIKGDLNEDSLNALQEAVEHQLESDDVIDVVLNVEETPFVDSATFEYLLDLQDTLAEKLGQVKFAGCDENVRKILEMTRMDIEFEMFADVAEAVKSMQP
ncbi:MAG: STAS domain-containing protein [Planctomycetota bacterium]|jgi:anti-anti-sigma factor